MSRFWENPNYFRKTINIGHMVTVNNKPKYARNLNDTIVVIPFLWWLKTITLALR